MITAKPYLQRVEFKPSNKVNIDNNLYPFSVPAIKDLCKILFHADVTFIVGENGSGKSTILEAIAIAFGLNAEGGSRDFNFSTNHSHSDLHEHLRLIKSYACPKDSYFLRAESFFNVATQIDELEVNKAYACKSLHRESHGESFWTLFTSRFRGKGLYFLDEPEAALSPMRQIAFLRRMHQLITNDSQFIISTHSPILMAYPNAIIYQADQSGIHQVNYKDTEHYCITKVFLQNPERMITDLFGEDDLK